MAFLLWYANIERAPFRIALLRAKTRRSTGDGIRDRTIQSALSPPAITRITLSVRLTRTSTADLAPLRTILSAQSIDTVTAVAIRARATLAVFHDRS